MEKTAIEARITELQKAHDEQARRLVQLEQAAAEAQKALHMIEGMITECQYWLGAAGEGEA